MNQDILSLYKKAQNGGLNAQEVFWLEGQAASHPCFGMAYMILARHHYRNQSTIKNKALLKAAAYANNRKLLRSYLEDTLTPPKQKPVPVSEMKPFLEQKAENQAASKADLLKKPADESPSIEVAAPELVFEAPPVVETMTPEFAPEIVAQPEAEVAAPEAPVENEAPNTLVLTAENATPTTEVPSAAIEAPIVAEADALVAETEVVAVDAPVMETVPVAEVPAESAEPEVATEPEAESEDIVAEVEKTHSEAVPTEEAAPVAEVATAAPVEFVGKPGEVNWFLNMRIRLRTDKHKGTSARLAASISKHAAADVAAQPAVATPVAEVAAVETPVAETPAVEAQVVEAVQPEVVEPKAEPVIESVVEPVEAVEEVHAPEVVAESQPISVAETVAAVQEPASKTKAETPEKQYEIGSFSSFTFLAEGGGEDAEEEIDTNIATLESVEFKAAEGADGAGEIIFEENDRIVEITVSPDALNKYFKGRLPSTPSMPSFGEFRIELDELEYRAAEIVAGSESVETPAAEPAQQPEVPASELGMLSFELLDRPEDTPEPLRKAKIEDIIDRFIENEPGITRAKSVGISTGDLSKESNQLREDEWVTETLAKIYEKQGNKNKAIKIYERLRLRFPEKNDYFVSLIQKLKH